VEAFLAKHLYGRKLSVPDSPIEQQQEPLP